MGFLGFYVLLSVVLIYLVRGEILPSPVHCTMWNIVVMLILIVNLVWKTWDIPIRMRTTLALHHPFILFLQPLAGWWVASSGPGWVWGHSVPRPHHTTTTTATTSLSLVAWCHSIPANQWKPILLLPHLLCRWQQWWAGAEASACSLAGGLPTEQVASSL